MQYLYFCSHESQDYIPDKLTALMSIECVCVAFHKPPQILIRITLFVIVRYVRKEIVIWAILSKNIHAYLYVENKEHRLGKFKRIIHNGTSVYIRTYNKRK